jgi:hypothetical protein
MVLVNLRIIFFSDQVSTTQSMRRFVFEIQTHSYVQVSAFCDGATWFWTADQNARQHDLVFTKNSLDLIVVI